MADQNSETLITRDGAVLTITLNRPEKHNALTFGMYTAIAEACEQASADVRCVIITGAGQKAFAAGTDIAQFRAFKTPEDGVNYEHRVDEILTSIERCPVPVIAAISGACTGGGAAIVACCDIRLGTRDMKYGYPIARTLGNCLSASTLQRLVHLMGPAPVAQMLYSSDLMTAEQCLAAQLVTEVLDDYAALMARANALARQIAANAPLTIATTKTLLRRLRDAAPKVDDRDLVAKIYTSADFREGLESFLAKRKPLWTGR